MISNDYALLLLSSDNQDIPKDCVRVYGLFGPRPYARMHLKYIEGENIGDFNSRASSVFNVHSATLYRSKRWFGTGPLNVYVPRSVEKQKAYGLYGGRPVEVPPLNQLPLQRKLSTLSYCFTYYDFSSMGKARFVCIEYSESFSRSS